MTPRRARHSAFRAVLIVPLALAAAFAAPAPSMNPPSGPAARSTSSPAPPPVSPEPPLLRWRLGPDSMACGVSLPAGGFPKRGKAGLIVWLHGGMRSGNREKGFVAHRGWLEYLPPRSYVVCSPSAYAGAEWPTAVGLAHIESLVDSLLRAYPIDPGDVNMVGVSDGCLGVMAYSVAGRHALRRRVLISSAPQLVVPEESLPGRAAFARGSWDFVQGGRDRLFPAAQVMPYLERFRSLYPNARVHAFPDGEHDFSWYTGHAPELLRTFFRRPPG